MRAPHRALMLTGRDRRGLTLFTCCFSLFMAQLDTTIVNVGLPSIQHGLHSDISGLQWVIDAYVLVLGSLAISSGAAGDRFGRRRVFRTGLMIFTLASFACSLAPSLPTLVGFRALQGLGASMLMPSTLAIIAAVFRDEHERRAAIGVWGGVAGLSMVAGPLLGGVLVASVGWRSLFWVNLPVGALALAMTVRYVPESRAPHPRNLDVRGQALLLALLALLAGGLIEAPAWGWTSARTLAVLGVLAATMLAFGQLERRVEQPMLDPRLLRRPQLAGATTFASLVYLAALGFMFLNTLYLQRVRGFSALHAGVAILPMAAAVAIAAPLSGRFTESAGARRTIAAAGVLIACAMGILATVATDTPYAVLAVAYALLGIGWGAINPPVTSLAMSALPAARAGMASAIAGTSRQVGSLLGVALMGSLVTGRLGSLGAHDLTRRQAERHAFIAALHLGYLVGLGAGTAVALLAAAIRLTSAGSASEPGFETPPAASTTERAVGRG